MPALIYDTTLKAWKEADLPRVYDTSQKAYKEYSGKVYISNAWTECFMSSDVVVELDISNGSSLSGRTVQLMNQSGTVLATTTSNSSGVATFVKPVITKGTKIRACVPSWDGNNIQTTYSAYITYMKDKGIIPLHIVSYTGVNQINSYDKLYIGSWTDLYDVNQEDFDGEHRVPDGIEPLSSKATWQYYSDSSGRWMDMGMNSVLMDNCGSKDRFGYPTGYYYDTASTTSTQYLYGPWRFQCFCVGHRFQKVFS